MGLTILRFFLCFSYKNFFSGRRRPRTSGAEGLPRSLDFWWLPPKASFQSILCDLCVLCGLNSCYKDRTKRPTGASFGRRAVARTGYPAIGGGRYAREPGSTEFFDRSCFPWQARTPAVDEDVDPP